jgi:mannonate dehydratase
VQCGIPGMPTASYAFPETKGEDTHFRSDFSGIQQKLKVLDSGCHMRFAPGSHPVIRREDGTMWNY